MSIIKGICSQKPVSDYIDYMVANDQIVFFLIFLAEGKLLYLTQDHSH